MLTVIGKVGCNRCIELKDKLTKEGIKFEYLIFDDIPRGPRKLYANIIRNENGGYFPLLLDDDGLVIKEE